MVAGNRGGHYEIDREMIDKMEEKRRREKERGEERLMKVKKQRERLRSLKGIALHLKELRIVMLGSINARKSSSGNTILDTEEFKIGRTAQCVKRQGEVAGRQLTVVDTPGWWIHSTVEETPELVKQEIVCSVSLCPPGPHAVLLVLRVDRRFTYEHRKSVEGHLGLLSQRVWDHTIVLFTHGDCLGDTTIEQYIESQGEALQRLVEKFGNRYHVFNNKNRGDATQVTELLEKIEEMVAGNRGGNFEIDREMIDKMEEKRRREKERGEERRMKVKKQRERLRSLKGISLHLSELRIVMLGYQVTGKSSSGNTILDTEEFKLGTTAQCVKRQGEVAGRQLTVVDTPGWWIDYTVEETPELVKQEIVCSVSLCPSGPHALLLVIDADDVFKDEHRKAVEGHLGLLSQRVWDHTIVLFTHGDCLGDTTIEQHIEREGEALQRLVEKCGNRYHVFNNKNRGDATQVTELLEKIEEMVAGNRGGHYEIDREMIDKMEEKRRREKERGEERRMKVKKQRERLRSLKGISLHLSELRIVMLGYQVTGKSSSGNTILDTEEFKLGTTAQCVKRQGEVAGRQLTVVDTPGWWIDYTVEETPELVKQEIVCSVSLCPSGPHAVLLVLRVDRRFTYEHRKSVEGHLGLLSQRVWDHTIVLFTYGDCLGDTTIEQYIESEGEALQRLVEKFGNRYHVFNNKNRGDATQVTELLEKIEEMVAGNRGGNFEIDREMIDKMEEKRRREKERGEERRMKVKKQRERLRSLKGISLHLSELRIVMLGYQVTGKSSSGNTILDTEEFKLGTTAQCVKRQGEVAGRQLTVVDTPGWWIHSTVEGTPELVKQEIVCSVSLCPSGPHVLLLVIDADDVFKDEHRKAVEGHLGLLSQRVWDHTIVLFTHGDCLGDTTIEQHIESEGEALQRLVEKCGNRYHVFNNENRGDATQVTELLEKIEEMVAGNRGGHYEIDREMIDKMEEKRRREKERGEERRMKVKKQRERLRSLKGISLHLSELRIVMLGCQVTGKSSSGNTILDTEEFKLGTTAQCVKRQGEVAGRQLTVVDTPGWWRNSTVEETPELVKQEIVCSVSLCPSGPHAVLLVLRVDRRFTYEHRKSVEGHLGLLSQRVWDHTIVLFTYGDCLGDTTIEQYIESQGEALQRLVEKFGNRYHVFNNKNRGDATQVTELLEKIEEMVAGNRGGNFEIDREMIDKMEEKRRREKERGEERRMKVKKQRERLRSLKGISLHLSELRIVMLGYQVTGKSSSGNTILDTEEFKLGTTAQCVKRQGEVAGRQLTVVDTPGWWRTYTVEETPELVKQEIVCSVSLCPPGPHVLLLVIDADDVFKDEHRKAVEGHLGLLSQRVWDHTIVLFTHGDCLGDTTIEQHIESEGEALQRLVEKCANRYHVFNNENRGDATQVTELLEKIEEMVAGNRGGHYEIDREMIDKMEEKRRREKERGEERRMKVKKQRERLRSLKGISLHLSELRIVMLGYQVTGKSSSGNTILDTEEFKLGTTAQCVKRQGEVAGRQLTVVDTPGWWIDYTVEETPELVKQEIVCSVSLCPSGPHALLLVIDADDVFKDEHRKAVKGHLGLLSQRVWDHTIVLFTHGDCLGDTTIEQHIEREGEALQRLVEKCGNRYHVFNNKNRGDATQVTELLEKIEEMVAGNRGGHYEIDREMIDKMEEKRRREKERGEERRMKVKKQRERLRSLKGISLHLSELRIVMLGYQVTGKSSSGNTILDTEEFKLGTTAQCVKRQGEVAGRQLTVVDTPGWWIDYTVEETPELVKQEIVCSVSLCPSGPHALLLVIDADDVFKDEHRKAVKGHLGLLSQRVWDHTIVLFTHGDCLGDTTIEQHIEREGEALQRLVEKCGNRYHVFNNKNRGDATQVTELLEKIEEMVAGNRGGHYEIDREMIDKMEEKRRREKERGEERRMKVKKQRERLRSLKGISLHLSELRIVMLGCQVTGKSSSGNTILDTEEFKLGTTAQCVKRQGEVAGRQLTVVDTPGWWIDYTVEETPELVKQEIVCSVSLCPPGPHALLLVIDADYVFKDEHRKAVEGHLGLLSQRVWDHTIVLFTHGDCLGDTTIDQYIESQGEALQRLVEKCGNRYHVFNNENRGDDTQVTELLEKIEEMVAGDRGGHYEIGAQSTPSLPLRKAMSKEFPPDMSEEELSERWSLGSSVYGSMSSSTGSSVYGSLRSSISTQSSGVDSLRSFQSGGRRLKIPSVFRKGQELDKSEENATTKGSLMKVSVPQDSQPSSKNRSLPYYTFDLESFDRTVLIPYTDEAVGSILLKQIQAGVSLHLSELRIVMLGNKLAGKSSSGNTILDREEFKLGRTAQCVKRQGEVAGRQLTVVDTPGWWIDHTVEKTAELVKQEIVCSVSLCPPGPLAFLLVIEMDTRFTDKHRKSVEGHLGLLSQRVWDHTIVLFTYGDCLGDTTSEQHIESEGEALQRLVEKCGNRYHVFNNENRGDATQVTELLEKIEEMVAGNRGGHYEIGAPSTPSLPLRKATSMDIPPHMSEDDFSDRGSTTSSAYGSQSSLTSYGASSLLGSSTSLTSTLSPGVCSLASIPESVTSAGSGGRFKPPKVLRPRGELYNRSSGNTILEREELKLGRTAQCVKRQGEVAGRQLTVVDTPGWWMTYTVEKTAELVKQAIVCSVSLCPPGPHAVLLVIEMDEDLQIHTGNQCLGSLSQRVWDHTIVLFTYGYCLGDTTIEQHIESEGEALQRLVEKCGNRYHVFNNENRGESKVTELLEKIEEMVAGNRGGHFEIDREIIDKMEEKRRREKERGEERRMKVKKQRERLRSLKGVSLHLSEQRIVMLGNIAAGKSSSGNTILEREEFKLGTTAQCVKRQGEVAGRQLTVVDTPGWWRNSTVEKTPELVKQEIVCSVSLCPPGPHAVLLVLRVDRRFAEKHRKSVEGHLGLLSQRVWDHTIVLFTYGHCLGDKTIEQYIESQGEALQRLVEKCGNRYHVFNNENRDDVTQITELLEKIEELVAGNRGGHYEIDREMIDKMEEKRRREKERGEERRMKVKKQREMLRSLKDVSLHPSELRIVMLGNKAAGKSSSGNTILEREEFKLGRTAQCVKRQGEVAGRQLTVVDTPGWWRNFTVAKTPELVKQEIVRSVSLCPPGPHAVLLVLRVDRRFTDKHRKSVEGHLGLLSQRVWDHTIVLFTHGDSLGDTTIEQHIESEGEPLQRLVEKCGNRYHVFNNENRGDDTQVTELLEKIEEMVAGNRGGHYEIDREMIDKMEEKRRREKERGEERLMKVKKQRERLRSLKGISLHLKELRIVMLGSINARKSSSGNTILDREEFKLGRTAQCVKRQGEVAGRQLTVVDTPGWWMTYTVEKTPELVKQEIVRSVSLCPPGPHAFLLVIREDTLFLDENRESVEGHLGLLSQRVWDHTIVLFTHGDCLGDTTIEQHIESEGEALQRLVEKCGNRYHVFNNENRGDDTQVTELLEKIEEMVAGNRGGHYEIDREMIDKMEEKRRREKERGEERRMKVKKQRERLRSLKGIAFHLSELRIVMMGSINARKSSSGNTILDREEFKLGRTVQCVKRQGEVAGRQLTVVDTPGWWRNYTVEETPELVKQEIVCSVSLCPPGPHALLLVIREDTSFLDEYRESVEGHLGLLSQRVWDHTIVLFTYGDCLGDTTIEQHIEREGEALQRLVEKCGNRYHVFNNENRGDDTQVTELLEKIEEMVAGNRGGHYEIDREMIDKMEEKRRREKERGEERLMKVKKQREMLRSLKGISLHLSELRIVMLGSINARKSSSGNTILDREEFKLGRTAQCVKRQGEVAGRQLTVVDTPGWWIDGTLVETPELVKQEIVRSVSLCPPGPHALLLVIKVDTRFTDKHRKSVEGHLGLLSQRVWDHTIVLFTHGDCLGDTTIEQYIESEGEALQRLVEKCGNRYHVFNNENRGDDTQVTELLEKIEEMVAGNRGGHYEIGAPSTPSLPLRKAMSKEFSPNMSEDELSERWSLGSSVYGSMSSSRGSSVYGSLRSSISTQSSGVDSLRSFQSGGSSGSGGRRLKIPSVFRKGQELDKVADSEPHSEK
ncbi:LOW QUALITY PROTEIN: uncharacterized protein FYW47_011942 [Aplochiton taeniatus]